MSRISILDPQAPGAFAPLLSGALDGAPGGKPVLLGYTREDRPCAALAAVQQADSVLLRWIAVEETYRRQGVGGQLVRALRAYAAARGGGRIDTVVCLSDPAAAEALLLGQGFRLLERNAVFSIPLSAVLNGPLAACIQTAPNVRAVPLSAVSGYQLKEFNFQTFHQEGLFSIQPAKLLTDCSFLWMENGRATSCVLLAPCGEDVELQWLYGKKPAALRELLAAGAAALRDRCGPDTRIHTVVMQPNIESLIRRLAGGSETEEQTVLSFRWQSAEPGR